QQVSALGASAVADIGSIAGATELAAAGRTRGPEEIGRAVFAEAVARLLGVTAAGGRPTDAARCTRRVGRAHPVEAPAHFRRIAVTRAGAARDAGVGEARSTRSARPRADVVDIAAAGGAGTDRPRREKQVGGTPSSIACACLGDIARAGSRATDLAGRSY